MPLSQLLRHRGIYLFVGVAENIWEESLDVIDVLITVDIPDSTAFPPHQKYRCDALHVLVVPFTECLRRTGNHPARPLEPGFRSLNRPARRRCRTRVFEKALVVSEVGNNFRIHLFQSRSLLDQFENIFHSETFPSAKGLVHRSDELQAFHLVHGPAIMLVQALRVALDVSTPKLFRPQVPSHALALRTFARLLRCPFELGKLTDLPSQPIGIAP